MTKTIFEMTAPSPSNKVKDEEYTNWLKVTLALYYMKSGLHTFIKSEVDSLHQSLVQKVYAGQTVPTARCTTCHANCVRRNMHTGVWTFQNQCKLSCDAWFDKLLALHNNPKSDKIYWRNSDVSLWPSEPWECAKVFMPRGQQPTNTGPAESDVQALMVLLANCKHFHPKLSQQGLSLAHKISEIRNKVMHNGEMKVSDKERGSFMQQIIQLLEDSVSLMSLEDCKAAVSNIHKINKDSVDVNFNLDLEMTALRAAVKELRQEHGMQETKIMNNVDSLKEEYRQLGEQISKWFEDVEKKLELHGESTAKRFEDVKSKLELNAENVKENVVKLLELETKVELHGQKIAAAEENARLHGEQFNPLEKNIELHGERLDRVEKKVELQGEKLGAVEQIIVKLQERKQMAGENNSCMKEVRSCEKEGVHFELKELAEKSQDSHQGREMEEFENKEAKEKNDWDKQENIESSDGIICVVKQYHYLKSNMSRPNVMAIAKGLLDGKLISQDEYDRFVNPKHSRRHCIDMLLKKVIHEEPDKSELLKCFLDQLRSQDLDMAMKIYETEVNEKDRTAFHQVNPNEVVKRNSYWTQEHNCRILKNDILFFQDCLCNSPECVDSITDKLLSNFYISIVDHTMVMQSKEKMIPTLFNMMQFYHLDKESVFEVVLEQKLFEKWKTLRNGSPRANRKSACQNTLTMQSADFTGTAMAIASDDEVKNLYCFCWLVMDVGKLTLQSYFAKQYSAEGDLQLFLKSKERQVNMLYSKHIIKQWQIKIIQPPTGNVPEVKDLDISTICLLLIYLCQIEKPLNGWKELPSEDDQSVGADILRLLFFAEKLVFYCIEDGMNSCEFSEKWKSIRGAISRLSGHLVQEDRDAVNRSLAIIKKENIDEGKVRQITLEIYKFMVSKSGKSQDVKLSEIITMDVNEACSDQGNQSSFGTLLGWMKNAARAFVSSFAQRFQSKLIVVDEGSIILKLRVLKDLKLELLDKDFVGKNLMSLVRKGCFESRVKLRGPVLVTVYILSPEGEGKKEEIHFHLDLEAIKHDAHQLRGAHEVHLQSQDIKLLVEEMDPIGLQRWIFDQLQIDIDKQKRMNTIVSWQTLSRSDRMEILLDSLKMVDNGFDMLAQYCKENDQYVYKRVFEKQEQLSSQEESDSDQKAELSYHKGGGLQKLYSMKLDIDIDGQALSDEDLESDWESCLMDEEEELAYNKSNNGVEEETFCGSGITNKSCEKEGQHVELKDLERKSQDNHQQREMEEFENKEAKEKTDLDKEENIGQTGNMLYTNSLLGYIQTTEAEVARKMSEEKLSVLYKGIPAEGKTTTEALRSGYFEQNYASEAMANDYRVIDYDESDLLDKEGVSLTMKNFPHMILASLDYMKTLVKELKDTNSWDPKCDDASKALQSAYLEQMYHVCDLLVQEGVSLTMKNLPGIVDSYQVSLETVTKAVKHLKDTHNWDTKCDNASKALQSAYLKQKYNVCDLLVQEGVSLTMKNLLDMVDRYEVSLEAVKKAVQHLKDTDNWDPRSNYASGALQSAFMEHKYDVCDLLVQEGVPMTMKHISWVNLTSLVHVRKTVKLLKDINSWDPKCDDASKALQSAYLQQKYDPGCTYSKVS